MEDNRERKPASYSHKESKKDKKSRKENKKN